MSRELPEGPALPSFVQLLYWFQRPIALFDLCQRRYGDTFTIRLPRFPPMVFISDPAAIRQVFTDSSDVFAAGKANLVLKPSLGEHSLLLLDGPPHHHARKLMMPAFHGDTMRSHAAAMRDATLRSIHGHAGRAGWPIGQRFALHDKLKEITLDVILHTVFGLENDDDARRLSELVQRLLRFGNHPLFLSLIDHRGEMRARNLQERYAFSPWSIFCRLRGRVDAILYQEIANRRKHSPGRNDVLSLLLHVQDESGASLDDEMLRDELLSLLIAGHKTTATALAWTLYRMLSLPEIWSRVHQDVERGSHEYLDRVIKESLRLHPTVPIVLRWLESDQIVAGHRLPAGVLVAPSIYLAHRRAASWPDPERFDPDRFVSQPSPYEYLPFGGGNRRCLGMAFSLFEMRIVLTEIVRNVRLSLPRGYRPQTERRGITLAPSDGLPVVVHQISGP